MLPATGLGRLAESAAPADSYNFAGRMIRPYPPGNVKINNVMWPSVILGQAFVTWAYRDRMQQTVYLVTQSEATVQNQREGDHNPENALHLSTAQTMTDS
jgi:hypothetical protein